MVFSAAAIASVGGNLGAEASEKTSQTETQPQPQTSQELLEVVPLATPIAPEQETTYPEDFPHLRSGQDFVAWKVGEDWEIETTLDGEALRQRLKMLEKGEETT